MENQKTSTMISKNLQKYISSLELKKNRKKNNVFVAEGFKIVEELLHSGYNPKMIVADEPTGNLDKQTEKEILTIFKKLAHEEGKCVIIVTHSSNVCEMVDEVYDLKKVK